MNFRYFDSNSSFGLFKSMGIETVVIESEKDFINEVKKSVEQRVGIILTNNEMYNLYKEVIDSYNQSFNITILIIDDDKRITSLLTEAMGITTSSQGGN